MIAPLLPQAEAPVVNDPPLRSRGIDRRIYDAWDSSVVVVMYAPPMGGDSDVAFPRRDPGNDQIIQANWAAAIAHAWNSSAPRQPRKVSIAAIIPAPVINDPPRMSRAAERIYVAWIPSPLRWRLPVRTREVQEGDWEAPPTPDTDSDDDAALFGRRQRLRRGRSR